MAFRTVPSFDASGSHPPAAESPRRLMKTQVAESHLRVSHAAGLAGARELTLLTSSQGKLMLLAWGPYFENPCSQSSSSCLSLRSFYLGPIALSTDPRSPVRMGEVLGYRGPSRPYCTFRGSALFYPLARKELSLPDTQFYICLRGLRGPTVCPHPVIASLTFITNQEAQKVTLDKW